MESQDQQCLRLLRNRTDTSLTPRQSLTGRMKWQSLAPGRTADVNNLKVLERQQIEEYGDEHCHKGPRQPYALPDFQRTNIFQKAPGMVKHSPPFTEHSLPGVPALISLRTISHLHFKTLCWEKPPSKANLDKLDVKFKAKESSYLAQRTRTDKANFIIQVNAKLVQDHHSCMNSNFSGG